MKRLKTLLVLVCMTARQVAAQEHDPSWHLLQQLDSIRQSPSVSRHFASLYLLTTVRAIRFAEQRDPADRQALNIFETRFAELFTDAARASLHQEKIPPVWSTYFSMDSLSPVNFQLLGINAHINGNLWQALVRSFNAIELRRFRPCYRAFNRDLKKIFDDFFESSAASDPRFAAATVLIPGFSRAIGHRLLRHWRKRQFKMAELYYRNPPRFRKMEQQVSQKRQSLNRLICNRF